MNMKSIQKRELQSSWIMSVFGLGSPGSLVLSLGSPGPVYSAPSLGTEHNLAISFQVKPKLMVEMASDLSCKVVKKWKIPKSNPCPPLSDHSVNLEKYYFVHEIFRVSVVPTLFHDSTGIYSEFFNEFYTILRKFQYLRK